MKDQLILIAIFAGILFLIILSFLYAKKRELSCDQCGSKNTDKTGNKRDIDRSIKAFVGPMPSEELEYECLDCGHKFWSTIERIWKF